MKFVKIYEILLEEVQHLFDLIKQLVILTPLHIGIKIILLIQCCLF